MTNEDDSYVSMSPRTVSIILDRSCAIDRRGSGDGRGRIHKRPTDHNPTTGKVYRLAAQAGSRQDLQFDWPTESCTARIKCRPGGKFY